MEEQQDHILNGEHLEKHISDAGFMDVKVKKVKIVLGEWDKGSDCYSMCS